METNLSHTLKNPAYGGIFCLRKLLTVLLLFFCSYGFSQPRLEVSDAKKNFGFVKKGEVVKIDFEIMNKGNAPLIINEAEVSCSCTTVDFPKQPILPGQLARVTISFDTKSAYGRQDRIVSLSSNDPKSPSTLRYKGIILKS